MRVQATAKGKGQLEFLPGKLRDDDMEVGWLYHHLMGPFQPSWNASRICVCDRKAPKSEAHCGRSQPPQADLEAPPSTAMGE